MENKTLNPAVTELGDLSKQEKDVHQKARYGVALLCVEGKSVQDISAFLRIPYRTAARYVSLYKLDDAKIHHAKLLREFLDENQERLNLVFLPPYSPNLNKIEQLWRWLKDFIVTLLEILLYRRTNVKSLLNGNLVALAF